MGRIYFSLHSHIFYIFFHQTKQSQCLQQALGSCFHVPSVHSAVCPHLSAIFVPTVGHNFSPKFYQHCIEDLENFKGIPNKNPVCATQHEVCLSPPPKAFNYCCIQFVIYFSKPFLPYCFPSTCSLSVFEQLRYSYAVNMQTLFHHHSEWLM